MYIRQSNPSETRTITIDRFTISSFSTLALSPFVPQTETLQTRMQPWVSRPLISSQAEIALTRMQVAAGSVLTLPSFLSQVEVLSMTMQAAGGSVLAFHSLLSQVEMVLTRMHISGGSGVCRRSHRPREMKGLLAQSLSLYPFLSLRLKR